MAPPGAGGDAAAPQGNAAPAPAVNAGAGGAQPSGAQPNGVRNFGNQRRMISELERINALNLEPSLPKEVDGNRNVSKYSQDRDKVKNEFQQFLTVMKKNDEAKASSSSQRVSNQPFFPAAQKPAGATASQPNLQIQPTFTVDHTGPPVLVLSDLLNAMLSQAASDRAGADWPEANGPSYHEVLGKPTGKVPQHGMEMQGQEPADPGARPGQGGMQGNHQRPNMAMQDQMGRPMGPPSGNPMQQQQQQQQGGYMMGPGGPQQGGQPQMMQFVPGMGQGGFQGMQAMQGMQMQGGQMVVGPGGQMMMAAQGHGGMMAMPQGMMPAPGQGGPNPQGGGMPYVGADGQQQQMMFMPVMMAQDQQGNMMMPPQGMQGYPQQPGGNQNPQQGGYMMQQPAFQQQANTG